MQKTFQILGVALCASLFTLALTAKATAAPPPSCTMPTTLQGTLNSFTTGPGGQAEGFNLYTNPGIVQVKYPPHLGGQVAAIVGVGTTVSVTGCLTSGPRGKSHLHAQTITNTQSGQAVTINQPGAPPPPPVCTTTTIEGSVAGYRTAPHGEIDGVLLNTNPGQIEVRFPPHHGLQVQALGGLGTTLRVTGCAHTGPAGDTHFQAQTITNPQTNESVTVLPPGACATTTTFQGTVSSLKYAPHGEVDGLFLNTGSGLLEVRFPPHTSSQVLSIIGVGTAISAAGCEKVGPRGDRHLKAQTITNTTTGQSVTIQ
jgi:hypothetical protein